MLRILILLLAASSLAAGAKEGPMRWSTRKTGDARWQPALVVPAARDDQTPGVLTLRIEFKANEPARFVVIGDGDSPLEIIVQDAQGREVTRDGDSSKMMSDLRSCSWTPARAETYTILLVNRGKLENVVTAGCN
jgi:hypothetical protein